MKRLNEQLRQINAALRRQAKIESYAPTLSYAPAVGRIPENEVIVDPRKHELISHLKSGKNFLRNQDPDKAFVEFKTALELAQSLADPTEEKKAARGLGWLSVAVSSFSRPPILCMYVWCCFLKILRDNQPRCINLATTPCNWTRPFTLAQ